MGEIVGIVVAGDVVQHHRGVTVLGDVFQVVDQEAAGVTFRQVVVVLAALDVFDLKAHHVIGRAAVPDDGGVGLANVDAGVRGTDRFGVIHQDVLGFHRVDAVTAAVGTGHVIRCRVAFVERRGGAFHLQAGGVVFPGNGFTTTGPDGPHVQQSTPLHALELEGIAW